MLIVGADIRMRDRITTDITISKRVDNLVDREVDAAGPPKPHPKSVLNNVINSDGTSKKRQIVESDDDSDDDVPLVHAPDEP